MNLTNLYAGEPSPAQTEKMLEKVCWMLGSLKPAKQEIFFLTCNLEFQNVTSEA